MRARRAATILLAALCLPACSTKPVVFPLDDLEAADHRFVPPRPDARSVAQDILAKEELSLDDVLAIADAMSPVLAAERKNVDLATAAIWEARLYPNPSLLLEVEDYKTGSGFGDSKRTAGVSVPLVLSDRIHWATQQAEKEREVAAVSFVWRRREILSDVKKAFFAVLADRRVVELTRETRDLARKLHEVTSERYQAQAIAEMELLKTAVALAKAESDLRLAEKELALSLKTLHARIGNVDLPTERLAGDLASRFAVPSLEVLRGLLTTGHPLLAAAVKAREAAEMGLSRARAERIPDIGLELRAGQDVDDDTIVQGALAIPLPMFNRNQGKIAAAEVHIRTAELQLQSVRNDLILGLTEAYKNLSAAHDRVAVYTDEILPKAHKAVEQTDEGYKLGKFGYLDVLDAQRTLAEARIAYAAAVADVNQSAAEVEKLTGTRLEPIR